MRTRKKRHRLWAFMITALAMLYCGNLLAHAQTFDSGSDGSDGALSLVTPGTIEFDPVALGLGTDHNNIYHFTTITIGAGVTVRLTARKINRPVFWLASDAVQINGTIDLNGEHGQIRGPRGLALLPSVPGSGGFPGGASGYGDFPPQPGRGPGAGGAQAGIIGGGAGHVKKGDGPNPGAPYGNDFLVPLVGGSGGGGGPSASGGAGGGALLIASSISITVNGAITANAGGINGNRFEWSGGGSGGAIRLIAQTISGTGKIDAAGSATSAGNGGSPGRVRLEAFQRNFTGTSDPGYAVASPFGLYLPTTSLSSALIVTKVNGVAIPNPTGSFEMPDVTIDQTTPITVNIEAHNIPPGTVTQLYVFSENGPDQVRDSTPLAGTLAASTATASVTLPPGFSRGYVRAVWTNQ